MKLITYHCKNCRAVLQVENDPGSIKCACCGNLMEREAEENDSFSDSKQEPEKESTDFEKKLEELRKLEKQRESLKVLVVMNSYPEEYSYFERNQFVLPAIATVLGFLFCVIAGFRAVGFVILAAIFLSGIFVFFRMKHHAEKKTQRNAVKKETLFRSRRELKDVENKMRTLFSLAGPEKIAEKYPNDSILDTYSRLSMEKAEEADNKDGF